jgi:hypothetical protein
MMVEKPYKETGVLSPTLISNPLESHDLSEETAH